MIGKYYGITNKRITTQNPQANGTIERIHQTIGNMMQIFRTHEAELYKEDPMAGILGAVMFAKREKVDTTNGADYLPILYL